MNERRIEKKTWNCTSLLIKLFIVLRGGGGLLRSFKLVDTKPSVRSYDTFSSLHNKEGERRQRRIEKGRMERRGKGGLVEPKAKALCLRC
jgi:hypothetical protein